MTTPIYISRFTAQKPSRLSKRFLLGKSGELIKRTGGNLLQGIVERVELADMQELSEILCGLSPANALAYGVTSHEKALVLTKESLSRGQNHELPTVARGREYFSYPAGQAIMMLDYDPQDGETPFEPQELLEKLFNVCPELKNAPMVIRASASTFIYHGETQLRGSNGWRVFVLVAEGSDIPRAGKVLFKKCWLSDYGHIALSKAGTCLVRSIIDSCVWQPERLDFAGGAFCEAPLEQRMPDPIVLNPNAAPLETRKALSDLSPMMESQYKIYVGEAKLKVAGRAAKLREIWAEERAQESVVNLPVEDKESALVKYRNLFLRAAGQMDLLGDFVLNCESGEAVTVSEILDNPDKWHGKRFADPLEPGYREDKRIGYLNLHNPGKPYLFSHAHGGRRYTLHRAQELIRIYAGERVTMTERALELFRLVGGFYDRGGELVRVDSEGGIKPLNADGIQYFLDVVARWEKFSKRENEWVPADAPQSVAKGILAKRGDWGLPNLDAVITAPTMDIQTGRLLETEGYDKNTKLLLQYNDHNGWPGVTSKPSLEDVEKALKLLWKPFEEFPFRGPLDKAVMLAALLTSIVRASLPTAPGFLLTAPIAGSGKTLLAKCLGILSGISSPPVLPVSGKEEEMRKRLLALGRMGSSVMVLDNITGEIESDSLCSWLTSEIFMDRVLGVSESIAVPTKSLLLLTGNNVILKGDLCRRVLTCRIDPKMETPWKRSFELDPAAWCQEHKLEMVAAALTLLRANCEANVKLQGRTASFELWSDTIRKAVVWIGKLGFMELADPVESIDESYNQDPETAKLTALLHAWRDIFGESPVTVAKIIQRARKDEEGALFQTVEEIAGDRGALNPRILGRWIEKRAGRICDNLLFVPGGKSCGVRQWQIRASGGLGGFGGFQEPTHEKSQSTINLGGAWNSPETHQSPSEERELPQWAY